MNKKKEPKIPKTITFFGRRLVVLLVGEGRWIVDIGRGLCIYVYGDETGFDLVCFGKTGSGRTVREALDCLEPRVLEWFKSIGECLNYDVE